MSKYLILYILVPCVLFGCSFQDPSYSKTPPGQVQKSTGYNPASGKCHPQGGPPGQMKKRGGCFGRTSDSCACEK